MKRSEYTYISKRPSGNYQVECPTSLNNRKKKCLGTYTTLSEAITVRDSYLNTIGCNLLPKGIHLKRRSNDEIYVAQLALPRKTLGTFTIHIGSYNTQEEAIQARLEFIESLK